MTLRSLIRRDDGAAAIEMAFALPILVMFIWTMVQYAAVFRANAGIQHALGEGARAATVWTGEDVDLDMIKDTVEAAVYGIGPGHFSEPTVVAGTGCDNQCVDVTVTYTQSTDLLLMPGPTVTLVRTKRVWTPDS